jgi:hypothetical protein
MKDSTKSGIMIARLVWCLAGLALILAVVSEPAAQKKVKKPSQKEQQAKAVSKPENDLAKLREDYINATKDVKTNLGKLLAIYEANVKKAEDKLAVSKKLFDEGLVSKKEIDEYERAVATEKAKVADTSRQIAGADTQIADTLVEAKADAQMARGPKLRRGTSISTTSFIRYSGAVAWSLNDAWKVQRFFSDAFKKPLPIAVFGQGAIHDRWRLDHRNAMDISLNPDGLEGQALMGFLRNNGIPFSAFREAIPGTATGPHIHIGLPSHRS